MRRDFGIDVFGAIQQTFCLVCGAIDLGVIFVRPAVDDRVLENRIVPRPGIASRDKAVVVFARYMNQNSLHGAKLEDERMENKRVIWI